MRVECSSKVGILLPVCGVRCALQILLCECLASLACLGPSRVTDLSFFGIQMIAE